ncbi:MAG: alcohol dehydrogenase catalytic domain-containing protein [Chloroflexi bacterium]|nr:alcohol dehydrogenase catalytic domain-containing protein [Chloroflexota bacterium]
MKALVKPRPGPGLELIDLAKPVVKPGEVLLRSTGCGICGGDVDNWRWKEYVANLIKGFPRVIGHEFSGHIAAVGEGVTGFKVGDRVVVEPAPGCGQCDLCRMGKPNVCSNQIVSGLSRDGGLAEFVTVPVRALYKIPDSISDVEAPLLETLAVGVHALERTPISPGQSVAVIGAGSIGLLLAQAARAGGAAPLIVTGTSRSRRRLELAKRFGAEATIVSDTEDVVKRVRQVAGGEGVDVVFAAAGPTDSLNQATQIVRRGGRICILASSDEPWMFKPFSTNQWREVDMHFSSNRIPSTWFQTISLVATGRVDLKPIIDLVLPLERSLEGFQRIANDRDVVKVVITP